MMRKAEAAKELAVASLLGALSLATDAAAGFPPETAMRTGMICVRLARLAGLDAQAQQDAYFAGVLRYLGCTGYAPEQAALNAGDDTGFLQLYADLDLGDAMAMARRTVKSLAAAEPWPKRAGAVISFLAKPSLAREVSFIHCSAGAMLAERLGFGAGVTAALFQMYERWDGKGGPAGHAGEATGTVARVLAVAQVVEVALRIGGLAAAKSVVAQRAGGQLDPRLAAQAATELAGLCEGLGEATVTEHFLAQEPSPARSIAAVQLPQLAEAFGMFADLKSAFMLDHSRRVAALCELAAQHRGLPVAEREPLVLAAHLHDLGRVAIASGLWDKPVRWSEHERKRAETHPLHLLAFMRQSGFLVELAPLAAAAGERLDGSGFPNGLTSARLGDAQRLLSAADVLVALTSARPHRKAYSNSEAARLMAGEVSAGRLDRKAVSAVLDAMALRKPRMEEDLPDGLTGREAGIIRLLAEGLSNKAIAARIGISPRTVQSHVASILGKTGLKGRAAAALYAMRHGLADFQPFGG